MTSLKNQKGRKLYAPSLSLQNNVLSYLLYPISYFLVAAYGCNVTFHLRNCFVGLFLRSTPNT